MSEFGPNGGDRAPPSKTEETGPRRKRLPHLPVVERHNGSIIVFVTVCTQGRKPLLAMPDAVAVLRQAWAKADTWRVGLWVAMPDHVHLFCAPNAWPPQPLSRWISFWKSEASRHWPRAEEHPLWQRDFWDTQLRPGDHYGAKWHYVRDNPVRAGLCASADAWPFQGEEYPLMWTE